MEINITLDEALAEASPSLRRKMLHTVDIIRKAESLSLKYDPEKGFYVGFSGGKDSQALYHMMQLCGVKMFAYFNPSSIDPPENIRFIRKNYPEVKFTHLKESIFTIFKRMKVLPSMKIRWCCAYFKESKGEGKVVCTGVRKSESVKRSKRNEIEVSGHKFSGHIDEFADWQEKKIRKKIKHLNQDQFAEAKESEVRCINGHDKILLNPIIEWTENDVWEFLNNIVKVPHCELYDEGWTRIGCICCPMANTKYTLRDIKRWSHVKEKWIRAIMDVRKESILGNSVGDVSKAIDDYPPPSESLLKIYTINGLYPPPNNRTRHSLHGRNNTQEWEQPIEDLHRTFRNCTSGYWRGVPTGERKFLDGDNGESSAVVAEYDEEKERTVAEYIFDWWISKKSFNAWYADRFLQGKLDLDFNEGEK